MTPHPALAGIPLVLGGNVFGWTADRDTSFAVLDAFYEGGGRMIDTADVYSAWVPGHRGGESETVLGEWLKSRGVRAEMRIHTKTGMLGSKELYEPERVLKSLDRSLERLRTDYVDLYYAHIDYEELPVGEIVAAFDGAVRSCKVHSIGASKFSAGRLADALDFAEANGAVPFSILQNQYNLVDRAEFEGAAQDLCLTRGVPMLPFFGLANGFLTGKYRTETDFANSERGARIKALAQDKAAVLAALDAVAAETEASHAQIALAWLLAQPGIGAPLASATTPAQVGELCGMASLALSHNQLAALSAALD